MFKKLAGMTGTALTEAGEFHKIYKLDVVQVPTNLPLARLDGNDIVYRTEKEKWKSICDEIERVYKKGQPVLVGTTSIEKSEKLSGLLKNRGIAHEVLNAKNHEREAMIVALAGEKGAVTVATNMAGRGTDIKLGGNFEYRLNKALEAAGLHLGDLDKLEDIAKIREPLREKCAQDEAEVLELGGLYVLGTERHEARRIDNQLRGRSGRQGDVGESRFYLSLQDDLMRIFYRDWVTNAMERLGMAEGVPIESGMVSRAIARAQKKVEDRNFEIRKNLLEYDEVMDQQRKTIYGVRQEVLASIGLKEKVVEMIGLVVRRSAQQSFFQDAEGFQGWFQKMFGFELDGAVAAQAVAKQGDPEPALELVLEQYEKREGEFTPALMRQVERYLLLNAIDSRWKDHLHAIDALKAGIGLRGYAQVDPKNEYKREGFQLFEKLMHAIEEEVSSLVLRIRVRTEEPPATDGRASARQSPPGGSQPSGSNGPGAPPSANGGPPSNGPGRPQGPQGPRSAVRRQAVAVPASRAFDYFKRAQALNAQQAAASASLNASDASAAPSSAPSAAGSTSAGSATNTAPSASSTRESAPASSRSPLPPPKSAGAAARAPQVPVVGRNDPCPCGSGQKYKKCHGRGE